MQKILSFLSSTTGALRKFFRTAGFVLGSAVTISAAPAQMIDLYGTIRTTIGDVSDILQVNVGDPIKVSLALKGPRTTKDATLTLFSNVTLTLKIGDHPAITLTDIQSRMEAGHAEAGASDPAWGISAFGSWTPQTIRGVDVRIYTALASLADVGNTAAHFPANIPLESFDLYNGGSLNFRPSGAEVIWVYERYSISDEALPAAPEASSFAYAAAGLLMISLLARRRATRLS